MLALSPLGRVNKKLTADLTPRKGLAPALWPRSACLVSSPWGMRHAGLVVTMACGVTGSGHDRHCAVGIGTSSIHPV